MVPLSIIVTSRLSFLLIMTSVLPAFISQSSLQKPVLLKLLLSPRNRTKTVVPCRTPTYEHCISLLEKGLGRVHIKTFPRLISGRAVFWRGIPPSSYNKIGYNYIMVQRCSFDPLHNKMATWQCSVDDTCRPLGSLIGKNRPSSLDDRLRRRCDDRLRYPRQQILQLLPSLLSECQDVRYSTRWYEWTKNVVAPKRGNERWLWRKTAPDSYSPLLAQPLSDQIWVNRAFCGKSTKFGTHVHDTKKSKFSYSAKPDFPCVGLWQPFKKMAAVSLYLRN